MQALLLHYLDVSEVSHINLHSEGRQYDITVLISTLPFDYKSARL